MAILVDENTKILIQGITGSFGGRHAQLSLDYGTQLVAGVTPGKGGQKFAEIVPIFDTVGEAVAETGATVSAVFVPLRLQAMLFLRRSMPVLNLLLLSQRESL